MSNGLVVEDMNQLHGRYIPSKPGMIPRFDQRRMGAVRANRGHRGGRHIVFGSKSDAQISNPGPMNKPHQNEQSSGAHRKIAVSFSGDSASKQPRNGVHKRSLKGESSFSRQKDKAVQQDLFEKVIPVSKGAEVDENFEIQVQYFKPVAEVAHEFPVRRPGFWKRFWQSVSKWLRKG